MASSKTAPEVAQTHAASKDETRAVLTELYERLTEGGRGPDLASEFARTNKEQGAPLDKHEKSRCGSSGAATY